MPSSFKKPSQQEAEAAVKTLLAWVGDDPTREGLLETPKRVANAFLQYFSGYEESPALILKKTFGETGEYNDFVLLKDIAFYSHCEHHIAPFFGKAHVAYWPKDRIVGLSKLVRLVDLFARRLQTQERLTSEIAQAIQTHLNPRGVAVIIDSEHQCMSMRGVMRSSVQTLTSHFTGIFKDEDSVRQRFLLNTNTGRNA